MRTNDHWPAVGAVLMFLMRAYDRGGTHLCHLCLFLLLPEQLKMLSVLLTVHRLLLTALANLQTSLVQVRCWLKS